MMEYINDLFYFKCFTGASKMDQNVYDELLATKWVSIYCCKFAISVIIGRICVPIESFLII